MVTPQTTDELETVQKYLECTVDEFNNQVKLLVIQHGAVALDVKAQLFNETETSSFVLQCSQHCGEYLPVGTHTHTDPRHAVVLSCQVYTRVQLRYTQSTNNS